jgi:hypothetical protein
MIGPIRTPSTVAHELIYCGTRDLTAQERAYVTTYHRITMRTVRAKTHAWEMFGRTSKAAAAAIWLAECEEKIDLQRALIVFEDVDGQTDVARRLVLV